jgi:hypothetical protein
VRLYRVAPCFRLGATDIHHGEIPHFFTQRHVYRLVFSVAWLLPVFDVDHTESPIAYRTTDHFLHCPQISCGFLPLLHPPGRLHVEV